MLEMGGGRDCMVSEIPSNSGGLPISNWNPAVRRQQLVNFSSHLKRSQKIFGSSSLAWEVVAHRHHSQDINRLFQMLYFQNPGSLHDGTMSSLVNRRAEWELRLKRQVVYVPVCGN